MVFLGLRSVLLRAVPKGADGGLYGGKNIMHGVKVTFSNRKTKRAWHPNVQSKKYHSHLLGKTFKVEMTTFVMRWIDKAGGFDAYIYNTPDRKLGSTFGSDLKKTMMAAVEADPSLVPPPRVTRSHAPPKRWTLGPPPLRKRPRPPFVLPKELTSEQNDSTGSSDRD